MADGLQLSARTVASLLARIIGYEIYDGPRYGWGSLASAPNLESGRTNPHPDPWRAVALNPQPIPPGIYYAITLADSHIKQLLELDSMATMWGGEVAERTVGRSVNIIAEIDDLCPRWPKWPKHWPVPPPPPPWWNEVMNDTELLVFGARFLAAAEQFEQGKVQDALTALGEKALSLSMSR